MVILRDTELKKIFHLNGLHSNKKSRTELNTIIQQYINELLFETRKVQDTWKTDKPKFRRTKTIAFEPAEKNLVQRKTEKIIKDYIALVAERMVKGVENFGTNTD